jgi:jumonji domain-containing protein 7
LKTQVVGKKHFTLLPPLAAPCIRETWVPYATYSPKDSISSIRQALDEPLTLDFEPEGYVPAPIWDPDRPEENTSPYSMHAKPFLVTLEPGDMLYLPTGWYHKVKLEADPVENFCCSVNHWYHMDYDGPNHTTSIFIRDLFRGPEPKHESKEDEV